MAKFTDLTNYESDKLIKEILDLKINGDNSSETKSRIQKLQQELDLLEKESYRKTRK